MAIILKDRVKVSSGVTGTGTATLGAAAAGFQSFAAIGNGNETYYTIALQSGNEWEVGVGTVTDTAGTFTLSRDTVFESSNAGNLVNFSTGSKDVFVTYPAERAIYEEPDGQTLIDGGPITVLGTGVTVNPSLEAELGKFVGNVDSFGQVYNLNQNDGSNASADFVAYNDLTTDGFTYFTDMGISSSNYTSVAYPLFTPNSGYVFHQGDDFFLGNETTGKDVVLFAGGVDVGNEAVRIKGADQSVELASDLSVAGTATITGAAEFQSTVLLDADPTLALQAATKQYVDNQVTAGLHIHEPVRAETTGNLNATYTQGGTTFNITDITGTDTVTTSVNHSLSVGDQIWLYTSAGNGLSINVAYFVFSIPAANQLTLSLTFGGAQITGLTNASGLTYATRANSGVGSTLTNAGTQVALTVDGVALVLTDRVMVRLQTNAAENGVYTVTTVGDGSTNWVLTRATDSNRVNPSDPNGVGTGDYYFTREGLLNAGDSHVLTTEPNTMILGYTALTFTQFNGSVVYTGGTNINVTGQVISLTGTVAAINGGTGVNTVAAGDLLYGSATDTWARLAKGAAYKSLVMNASGTNVEWNAVALDQAGSVSGALGTTNGGTNITTYVVGDLLYSSATNTLAKLAGNTTTTKSFLTQTGAGGGVSAAPAWGTIAAADVSGLAPSATTDTTNASNITTGTLGTGRLSGSYTGITGVGTLAAGTWNGSVIGAVYGGTGFGSYTVGDLLFADTGTSLAKLADVAVGNALISGGVAAAPVWGKIGLDTHVSGTLPIGNGGTGQTTAGAAINALLPSQTGESGRYLTTNGADPSWAAVPAPNNGTLTMGVSGTGLSGSATFTADQAGGSTFTVTSNATSANTAGAIVARDGSGDFTAGTITAGLSGNATTATTLQTARTINGVSFNGSADITVADATKLPLAGGTLSGALTVGGNLLTQGSARETRVALGAGTDLNLNLANYFSRTISGATTFTVSNVPANNTGVSIIFELTNGGSATVNFWANVRWAGGTAPALTASGRDVLGFFTVDNGANWNGIMLAKDIK